MTSTPADTMFHSWNWLYVFFSYLIAALASYVALELATGPRRNRRPRALLIQGFLFGYGIWAMHFIGMLAFQLPTSVSYDLPLTALSGLIAVVFLSGALMYLNAGRPNTARIVGSGVIAGTGISLMHYLGMAAMHTGSMTTYVALPFALSVLIAVGAATVAFTLFTRTATPSRYTGLLRVGAALIMGAAISGMHYMGMAAVQVHQMTAPGAVSSGLDIDVLGILLLAVTAIVFIIAIILITIERFSGASYQGT